MHCAVSINGTGFPVIITETQPLSLRGDGGECRGLLPCYISWRMCFPTVTISGQWLHTQDSLWEAIKPIIIQSFSKHLLRPTMCQNAWKCLHGLCRQGEALGSLPITEGYVCRDMFQSKSKLYFLEVIKSLSTDGSVMFIFPWLFVLRHLVGCFLGFRLWRGSQAGMMRALALIIWIKVVTLALPLACDS